MFTFLSKDKLQYTVNRLWTKCKGYFAYKDHEHTVSQITNFPASLPANGGDADTVAGHTVDVNVPANAKFTDTYTDFLKD